MGQHSLQGPQTHCARNEGGIVSVDACAQKEGGTSEQCMSIRVCM